MAEIDLFRNYSLKKKNNKKKKKKKKRGKYERDSLISLHEIIFYRLICRKNGW